MLLDTNNMSDYLTHQIEYFEEEDRRRPTYELAEWQKSYLRRFFENVRVDKETIILDIACGSGYMAVELARKGATVIASDLTLAQLQKLQNVVKHYKLSQKLFLVCCSAEALPFKSKIADVVIGNAILEHLPHEKEAIDEIKRVGKKHATIMISVPHAYRYLWPFLIPINLWFDKKIGHIRRYTKESLMKKFPDFSLEAFYYTGNILKFMLFVLAVLLKTNRFDGFAEQLDEKWKSTRYGATVITGFFRKNKKK